jgi:hypothetical protein
VPNPTPWGGKMYGTMRISTGNPTCEVCNGTGGIASACRCPCGGAE